jgi:hypothetical protein
VLVWVNQGLPPFLCDKEVNHSILCILHCLTKCKCYSLAQLLRISVIRASSFERTCSTVPPTFALVYAWQSGDANERWLYVGAPHLIAKAQRTGRSSAFLPSRGSKPLGRAFVHILVPWLMRTDICTHGSKVHGRQSNIIYSS